MGIITSAETVIYSETPIADIWRRLRVYTFEDNLRERLAEVNDASAAPLRNEIAASFEQAWEYFDAADRVSLSTSPVQLYYGTVSLLRALACLMSKRVVDVDHHGLRLTPPKLESSVMSASLSVVAQEKGALLAYFKPLGADTTGLQTGAQLSLQECLSLIPEVRETYVTCFGNGTHLTIPVERLTDAGGSLIDRLSLDDVPGSSSAYLSSLEGFSRTYLPPQETGERRIALRPRLGEHQDPTIRGISGERYFLGAIELMGRRFTPHRLLPYLMGLFILGSLSRYHPSLWRQFVVSTAGRARLVIEEFVRAASRVIPNVVLDLANGRRYVFTMQRQADRDLRTYVDEGSLGQKVDSLVESRLSALLRGGIK